MKVKTHLLAFEEDKIRMVEIDDKYLNHLSVIEVLEEVFRLGQNDLQPQQMPSLSVGDVVEKECNRCTYWLIMATGWKNLNEEEFEAYKKIPMRDRAISTYKIEAGAEVH